LRFSAFSNPFFVSFQGTILSLYEGNDYGFIRTVSGGEEKKIFFHRSEIANNQRLKSHDEVLFYLIKNPKSDRSYAVSIEKSQESPTTNGFSLNNGSAAGLNGTESLFKNLKLTQDISGPRVIVIRQPRAPDGTRGFKKITPSPLASSQFADA